MCYITFFSLFHTLLRAPLLSYCRALYDHSIKKVIAKMQHIFATTTFVIYREDPPLYMYRYYSSSAEFDMRYDLMNPSILPSITPPTSEVWCPVRWSFTRRSSKT